MTTFFSHRALVSQRASGYRNTAYALAELIDNALDANASKIRVIFLEKRDFNNRRYIDEILIFDNGHGMTEVELQLCLQFGGGAELEIEELVSSKRKGKFGYGLPNASLSQCPNVHVYSWQDKGAIKTTRLNLDEIRSAESIEMPTVTECELPAHYKLLNCVIDPGSGVIVSWRDCDRLSNTRPETIILKSAPLLGRLFRYVISAGTSISLEAFEFQRKSKKFLSKGEPILVRPNDPLFLLNDTLIAEKLWLESKRTERESAKYYAPYVASIEKCIATNHKVKDHCYEYKFRWRGRKYKFSITTSVADYKVQKPGIRIGAETEVGMFYGQKHHISFVRAGREIASGSFGGFYRATEPQHRWWSIEVQFDGDADDLLGVHNNKQGVEFSLTDHISEEFDADTATLQQAREELWLELTNKINLAYKAAWKEVREANKKFEHDQEITAGGEEAGLLGGTAKTEATQIQVDGKRLSPFSDEEREALIVRLKEKYPDVPDKQIVRSIDRYDTIQSRGCVLYFQSESDALWTFTTVYDFLIVLINTNHMFYENVMQPLRMANQDEALAALELFISSLAFEEKEHFSVDDKARIIEDFRSYVGLHLNRYIRDIQLPQSQMPSDETEEEN